MQVDQWSSWATCSILSGSCSIADDEAADGLDTKYKVWILDTVSEPRSSNSKPSIVSFTSAEFFWIIQGRQRGEIPKAAAKPKARQWRNGERG